MGFGTVERAFQLAPECIDIEELRTRLIGEGYSRVDDHLKGSLRQQLKKLLRPRENRVDVG
jgi:hypothetical protein